MDDSENPNMDINQKVISKGDFEDESEYLDYLAGNSFELYATETNSSSDLEDAIVLQEQSVLAARPGSSQWIKYSHYLVIALHSKYLKTGEFNDLSKGLDVAQNLVDTIRGNPGDHTTHLDLFRILLEARFQETHNEIHLKEALNIAQQTVDECQGDDPRRPTYLNNLAMILGDYFDFPSASSNTEKALYLERAIEAASQAVTLTTNETEDLPYFASTLGSLLRARFKISKKLQELNESIDLYLMGMQFATKKTKLWYHLLMGISSSFFARYFASGSLDDLSQAIEFGQKSVDGPLNKKNLPRALGNLLQAIIERYQQTGSLLDLDDSIKTGMQGLALATEDNQERGALLNNIAIQLIDRYRISGAIKDLQDAIEFALESSELVPLDAKNDFIPLHVVCDGLTCRYQRTSALADLEESMRINTELVERFPDKTGLRVSLASSFRTRYYRIGDVSDLKRCMELALQVMGEALPGTDVHKYGLRQLASAARSLFDVTKLNEFLEQCIVACEIALEATPNDDVERYVELNALAVALLARYQAKFSKGDLDKYIELSDQACQCIGEMNPNRARALHALGHGLLLRYEKTQSKKDIDRFFSIQREAVGLKKSFVKDRISAGMTAMKEHYHLLQWEQAYAVSLQIIKLIPQLILRSLTNSDKRTVLEQTAGLSSEAAALAIKVSESAYTALCHLEQGRGLLANSVIEGRIDDLNLRRDYPHLADRLRQLQEENNDFSAFENKQSLLPSTSVRNRQSLPGDEAWDSLVSEIRQQAGFEDFLLFPSEESLREVARNGPIVVINLALAGCDAILITENGVRSLQLDESLPAELTALLEHHSIQSEYVLEWLWEYLASPILDNLGFVKPLSDSNLPRLWWIMTGRVSRFPIHAAGYHREKQGRTVLDRVVSSYYTSVKALLNDYKRPMLGGNSLGAALLVAMDNTPGSSPLPSATKEIEEVRKFLELLYIEPIEPVPTKENIIQQLSQCKIFHFAGHGRADTNNPLESHLVLDKENTKCITLENLLDMNLSKSSPFLAYLSACGTGQTHEMTWSDENVHLINGFLVSGYRHVVGTLWSVKDEICVDMASAMYESIRQKGGLTDESVCWGVHSATVKLRNRWVQGLDEGATGTRTKMGQLSLNDTHEGPEEISALDRLPRDVIPVNDNAYTPVDWIPYVHFGV